MRMRNYCIACPCTFERGLVATLEAEVPQGRLQCGQGIEQPLHEQAPSGLAANFTLHITGTLMHTTSCQVACKHGLQLTYPYIDRVFRGNLFHMLCTVSKHM